MSWPWSIGIVVMSIAGAFAGAALYLLTNRSTHPLVESGKSKRGDGLPQELPGSHEHGQKHFESSGRKLTRQVSHLKP